MVRRLRPDAAGGSRAGPGARVEVFAPVAATVTPTCATCRPSLPGNPATPSRRFPRRSTGSPRPSRRRRHDRPSGRVAARAAGSPRCWARRSSTSTAAASRASTRPTRSAISASTSTSRRSTSAAGPRSASTTRPAALVAGPTALDSLGTAPATPAWAIPSCSGTSRRSRWLLSEFSSRATACASTSRRRPTVSGSLVRVPVHGPQLPRLPEVRRCGRTGITSGPTRTGRRSMRCSVAKMLTGAPAASQRFVGSRPSAGSGSRAAARGLGRRGRPAGRRAAGSCATGTPRHTEPPAGPTRSSCSSSTWTSRRRPTPRSPGPIDIPSREFDSDLCGLDGFSCFPQPGGTSSLDPVQQTVMHRVAVPQPRHRTRSMVGSFAST